MLEFRDISKSFGAVPVLRDVTFSVRKGSTLGLVGENGAGKSTLMNILGGNLRPDSGEMKLLGRLFEPPNSKAAAEAGIAFIHQELNLFPNLTIAENLFLTSFPRSQGSLFINRRELHRRALALLARVNLDLPPGTLVERLSAGERQLLEIAKALGAEARLIILDEPTTSLSARETESLFRLLAELRRQGITLIYISHNLADVLAWCDELVVLRDGAVVGTGPTQDFTASRLISLMVGRSLNQLFPLRRKSPQPTPLLEVHSVSQPGIVHDISFSLHRGEVLGLAGLMGAGRSELARILFGLDPYSSGTILFEGKPLTRGRAAQRIENGLAFLTENRREEGLCLDASIADNIGLVSLREFTRRGWLALNDWRSAVQDIRRSVRLNPGARDEQPVRTLSGGNQQKVVLAKWLLAKPKALLLDEPTRGIDVGAKFEIYQLIQDMADAETGILVISSEIEELIGICDRILVMARGEIHDELSRAEFDRERILRAALHGPGTAA